MPNWKVIVATAMLALVISPDADAQDSPQITIRATHPEPPRALDPVEFTVVISLPTMPGAGVGDKAEAPPTAARPKLALMTLEVEPEGPLRAEYLGKAECLFAQQGLFAGQQLEVPCFLHPKEDTVESRLNPSLSAVFARDLLLHVHLQTMQNNERSDASYVGRVKILPPLVAVFYGGVVGAFLLAVFRTLAPLRHGFKNPSVRMPSTPKEWVQAVGAIVTYVVRATLVLGSWLVLGGVSAIMIILLTKASTGELSPIQVEINDFVGGVLVGLLSFSVVAWLESKLLASESTGQAGRNAE